MLSFKSNKLKMLELRKVDESKIEDLYQVIHKCSVWMNDKKGMDHWVNYYTREVLLKKFKQGEVYIDFVDNLPIATFSYSTEPLDYYVTNNDGPKGETINYVELYPSSHLDDTKAFYLSTLAVDPDYQGKGIASKLLELVEAKAIELGCNVVRFDSRMAFKEVINFYLKRGYKKVGK